MRYTTQRGGGFVCAALGLLEGTTIMGVPWALAKTLGWVLDACTDLTSFYDMGCYMCNHVLNWMCHEF